MNPTPFVPKPLTIPFPGPLKIPSISNEELKQRYSRCQPLVLRPGKGLWRIQRPDLRYQSFVWDPKFTEQVAPEAIEMVGACRTLHTWGHYSLFKPSVAEVLAQLPENLEEIPRLLFQVEGPDDADDLNEEKDALNAGYHVATTFFYQLVGAS